MRRINLLAIIIFIISLTLVLYGFIQILIDVPTEKTLESLVGIFSLGAGAFLGYLGFFTLAFINYPNPNSFLRNITLIFCDLLIVLGLFFQLYLLFDSFSYIGLQLLFGSFLQLYFLFLYRR